MLEITLYHDCDQQIVFYSIYNHFEYIFFVYIIILNILTVISTGYSLVFIITYKYINANGLPDLKRSHKSWQVTNDNIYLDS